MDGAKYVSTEVATLYRPFTSAKTRYFDRSEMHAARQWAANQTLEARACGRAAALTETTASCDGIT